MLPSTVTNSSLRSCPVVVELHRPQLISPNRNAGLPTHDVHQHPDPPIGRDLLDLSHEVGKWPCVQCDLISRFKHLGRQHFALRHIQCRHLTYIDFPLGMPYVIRTLHPDPEQ